MNELALQEDKIYSRVLDSGDIVQGNMRDMLARCPVMGRLAIEAPDEFDILLEFAEMDESEFYDYEPVVAKTKATDSFTINKVDALKASKEINADNTYPDADIIYGNLRPTILDEPEQVFAAIADTSDINQQNNFATVSKEDHRDEPVRIDKLSKTQEVADTTGYISDGIVITKKSEDEDFTSLDVKYNELVRMQYDLTTQVVIESAPSPVKSTEQPVSGELIVRPKLITTELETTPFNADENLDTVQEPENTTDVLPGYLYEENYISSNVESQSTDVENSPLSTAADILLPGTERVVTNQQESDNTAPIVSEASILATYMTEFIEDTSDIENEIIDVVMMKIEDQLADIVNLISSDEKDLVETKVLELEQLIVELTADINAPIHLVTIKRIAQSLIELKIENIKNDDQYIDESMRERQSGNPTMPSLWQSGSASLHSLLGMLAISNRQLLAA